MLKDGKDWAGVSNFVWFFGVVEDIIDPINIGRVKVRCYGWHTDDREVLPEDELPWAQVMMPVTSASMAGVGQSPTGLIEGSHVIGFFMDGAVGQMPMIIGSFHGIPAPPNIAKGFTDPTGASHRQFNLPDTPNLAYDRWTADKITKEKSTNQVKDVPTAVRTKLSTADDVAGVTYNGDKESLTTWNEPSQRGDAISTFPQNHVIQTKSGHAFEVDDTPNGERIHEYHRSGTFYEVQPDGTKVTKIVGDEYEITAGDKNVLIKGNVNVTIEGDARIYNKGDVVHEIGGDYHLTVHGNRYTKIVKNDSIDILGNKTTQVNLDEFERVSGDKTKVIAGDETSSINKDYYVTTNGNKQETIMGSNDKTTIGVDTEIIVSDKVVGTSGKINMSASGNVKITGARIDLNE